MVGSLAAWPQRLFMEYLINQVAADIGVGDWGPRGARNHLRFPKCLNQIEKGPKMWKIGSDKHWLRPLVGGARSVYACGCRPLPSSPFVLITLCGPVLYCTVYCALYCTVLYCVLYWSHCVDLCSLWSVCSSSQLSSYEGRHRNDGIRGQHTRCHQNIRMAKHVN